MCTSKLQRKIIAYYFITYIVGILMSGLFTLFILYGGTRNIIPNTGTTREQILNLVGSVLGCFSTSYNICCQIIVFSCHRKHPVITGLSIILSLVLMFALAALLFYSTINLWVLLGICFVGEIFGGVFLVTAYMLHKDVVTEKAINGWLFLKQGGRKPSHIEEAEKEEDTV